VPMDGGRGVGVKPRNLIVVFELLDRLLELSNLFDSEVQARLDLTDCALLAQVGRPWLAEGKKGAVPRKFKDLVRSVELLAWAKASGCSWEAETYVRVAPVCATVGAGAHLRVGRGDMCRCRCQLVRIILEHVL